MRRIAIIAIVIVAVLLITGTMTLIIIEDTKTETYPEATNSIDIVYKLVEERNNYYAVIIGVANDESELSNLKNVDLVIPPNVTLESHKCNVSKIDSYSFKDLTCLRSVTIPKTVKEIAEGAFQGCYNIKKIDIRGHIADDRYGKDAFSLGTDSYKAELRIYGFNPVRDPARVDSDYKDVFGDKTTVHYQIIEYNNKDPLIHTGLLALGIVALLYMGRSVKVKRVDRGYKKGRRL